MLSVMSDNRKVRIVAEVPFGRLAGRVEWGAVKPLISEEIHQIGIGERRMGNLHGQFRSVARINTASLPPDSTRAQAKLWSQMEVGADCGSRRRREDPGSGQFVGPAG